MSNGIFGKKEKDKKIMPWICVAVSDMQNISLVERRISLITYQQLLEVNFTPSVKNKKLKMPRRWLLQQDHDLEHTSKSTMDHLMRHKVKVLLWFS